MHLLQAIHCLHHFGVGVFAQTKSRLKSQVFSVFHFIILQRTPDNYAVATPTRCIAFFLWVCKILKRAPPGEMAGSLTLGKHTPQTHLHSYLLITPFKHRARTGFHPCPFYFFVCFVSLRFLDHLELFGPRLPRWFSAT